MDEVENKENNGESSSDANVVVKKRTRKKKIRVELIKDSVISEDDAAENGTDTINTENESPADSELFSRMRKRRKFPLL